jgi:uncharacterized low-complexity protein
MNQKNLKSLALGAAIAGSLAAVPVAQASPFSLTTLGSAYMAAGDGDTKGAEDKGGADKAKAEAEGKCGEGKCGAQMKDGDQKDGEKKEGEPAKDPAKA